MYSTDRLKKGVIDFMYTVPDEAIEMVRLSNAQLTEIFYPKDGKPFQFRIISEQHIKDGELISIVRLERITYVKIGSKVIPQISILSNDFYMKID